MKIEPKFTINDLVQHKFQKPGTLKNLELRNSLRFFEVLYIHTETCSAGTQVFYRLRPFYPVATSTYKEDDKLIDLGFGVGENGLQGTSYFREDELKPMSDSEKEFYGI